MAMGGMQSRLCTLQANSSQPRRASAGFSRQPRYFVTAHPSFLSPSGAGMTGEQLLFSKTSLKFIPTYDLNHG